MLLTSLFRETAAQENYKFKLNFLLQYASKWFKINQLVLNTNKTFTVKFLSYKAPIYPLHLVDADHTLSVTDTI
jgi:hypothetical protein